MTSKSKYGKMSTHQWIALQRRDRAHFLSEVAAAIGSLPSAPSDSSWINALGLAVAACFKKGPPSLDRLAFLASTGKVELPIRDEVLWQLKQSSPSVTSNFGEWFGREYRSVDGVKGPGPAGTLASAAFQAKQICVADIYDPKNDLLQHLNLDIRLKAPWNLENRAASIQIGLLLVIDYGEARPDRLLPNSEKYSMQMKKQWNEGGCLRWQSDLAAKLQTLELSIKGQGNWDLASSANWPGLSLHWFIVTPEVSGHAESPN